MTMTEKLELYERPTARAVAQSIYLSAAQLTAPNPDDAFQIRLVRLIAGAPELERRTIGIAYPIHVTVIQSYLAACAILATCNESTAYIPPFHWFEKFGVTPNELIRLYPDAFKQQYPGRRIPMAARRAPRK